MFLLKYFEPSHEVDSGENKRREIVALGGLLVLITLMAYLPGLKGDFLWDDDSNVTASPALRTLKGLVQIWFQPGATQQYYPLTHTTFWIDYQLWGLHPFAYHLENVLLHALTAVMLWRLLIRLGVPGAWIGAALFALHPVNVESVAWITERKNTISGPFFIGAMFAAVKFWLPNIDMQVRWRPSPTEEADDSGPRRYYWLTLALYACALLCKTSTVALPVVIWLLVWCKRGNPGIRTAKLLMPMLVIGAVMGFLTMWVERHHLGVSGKDWEIGTLDRALLPFWNLWFYLWKLVWPHPLMFIYPRCANLSAQPLAYVTMAATLGGFWWLWIGRAGKARPALFALACFTAIMLPLLGILNGYFFRYSFVCDHFQYLATMAALPLAASLIVTALRRLYATTPVPQIVVFVAILSILGLLTWRQCGVYRNNIVLWRDALAHNPDAWMAHNNLGIELGRERKYDEALQHYEAALRIRHDHAPAYYNMGLVQAAQGNFAGAITNYQKAIQLEPNYAFGYYSLGVALANLGRIDEAIPQFNKAIQIAPGYALARLNLGNAFAVKGLTNEAIATLRKAVELDPESVEAWVLLGNTFASSGQSEEAIKCFRAALQKNPNHAGALAMLGNTLMGLRRLDEAVDCYRKALAIIPNHEGVLMNLGNIYLTQGKLDASVDVYQKALQFNSNNIGVRFNLATALARQGKVEEASRQYEEVLRLRPDIQEAQRQLQLLKSSKGSGPVK